MKKTLLTIFSIAASLVSFAQTPSPSWTIAQNSNFPISSFGIRYMDAISPNVAWATGYHGSTGNLSRNYVWVTKTTDGGTTWNAAPVWQSTATPAMGDTSSYAISNIDAQSGTVAWVGAYKKIATGQQGDIFKTSNGGTSWQNMSAPGMFTNTAAFCNWVVFLTPNVGIANGDPNPGSANEHELWKTTDAGATWTMITAANIPNPTASETGITNVVEKFGSSNIWFGTAKGRIFRSTDAGSTWNVSTVNSSNSITDIAFYDANNGLVITYPPSPSTIAAIYNTSDGGATWNLLPNAFNDANYGRNDVCAIPGTCWYASCGAGSGNTLLSFSMDNGNTWNNWGSTGIQYLAMDFSSPSNAWAGGFSDVANPALGGFYKFNGGSLLQAPSANFTVTNAACINSPIMLGNTSTGNECPTFTWTCIPPPATLSSSTAASPTISFSSPGNYVITLNAVNSLSNSIVSRTVTVGSCTGLENSSTDGLNFFVSPNPSKDVFNLSLPTSMQPYTVTITNVLGSVVYADKFTSNNGNYAINLSTHKTGMYFITLENNGVKTTKKIILE